MAFTPLTQDQYQKAISAGFTPDQIIANEKVRQQQSSGQTPATPTSQSSGSQNLLAPPPGQNATVDTGKLGNVLGAVFPGAQIGKDIGTLAGYGITAGKEALGLAPKGATSQYDLSAPSPLQAVGDVAKGAALVGGMGAAAPTSIASAVGQGALYGGIGGAGQGAVNSSGAAIPTGKDIQGIAKTGAIGSVLGGAISGATSIIGKLLESAGNKIINTAIKPTKADIEDGFDVKTITDNNLGGSLSTMYDKTEAKLNDLTQQLNTKLAGSDATVDLNDIYDQTVHSLDDNSLKSFGSNTSVGNALKQLHGEIQNVTDDGDLTIPQAQLVKQASGKYGAWQFGMNDPDSTARQTVYNAFYNNLKISIEDNSPDGVKEINQQLSKLIPVQNAIIRRIPVAERNSALSLTDMITLTASMFNPSALAALGLSLGQKEAAVGNILSKLGPAVSAGASKIGSALAPSIAGGLPK